MRTQTSATDKRWLIAACFLIVALPVVRLIEAALRSVYMAEHYGSFWQGLTKDLWFSEGWISYVQTPVGLAMTILPIVLICGAIGCVFLAVRTGSVHAKRRQNKAIVDKRRLVLSRHDPLFTGALNPDSEVRFQFRLPHLERSVKKSK